MRGIFLGAAISLVAHRARAAVILALVNFGISIAELDSNVALELVLKADSLHTGDGFDDGRFAVSNMADGTDVDSGLA